jgi:uncharacterized membrane protein (DUF373 family)
MRGFNKILTQIFALGKNENFLHALEQLEVFVSKLLSIGIVIVILVALYDLTIVLSQQLSTNADDFFERNIIKIFGLFLDILIALELLENVTVYLKRHIFPVELVLVTSLIAVARKIIIFDFEKYSSSELISLGVAILCLSISYLLVRFINKSRQQ